MTLKQAAAFFAISLIWGSTWLIQEQLPDPSAYLPFTTLALASGGISLAIVAAALRLPLPRKQEWIASAVLGVTLTALPYLLTTWISTHLSSGTGAVIAAATPLIAGFFCDTSWRARNASIAGLAGVLLIVANLVSSSWNQLPWAVILLCGTCAIAASLIFGKTRLVNCHPVYTAAIELVAASLVLGLASSRKNFLPAALPWMPLLIMAAGNAIAAALYFWLLKRRRVDQLTSTIWLQVVISVTESIWLLRPHIDWRIATGALMVIGSLFILHSSQDEETVLTVRAT